MVDISHISHIMFGSKKAADLKKSEKSSQKVLDTKKDPLTRLQHLHRYVVDPLRNPLDVKNYFKSNYSTIYIVFFDAFTNIEYTLRDKKANKQHREELELCLDILHHILCYLPELIHMRWQFHSIHSILKRLVHPGNAFGLRKSGIKLFLLWYQILQENASQDCHQMFVQLVSWSGVHSSSSSKNPGGGGVSGLTDSSNNPSSSFSPFSSAWPSHPIASNPSEYSASDGWLQETAQPLLSSTQPNETTPDKTLQVMLQDMVYEGAMVQWDPYPPLSGDADDEGGAINDAKVNTWVIDVNNKHWMCHQAHQRAFNFLWTSFKKYYLLNIFSDFDETTNLYDPKFDLCKSSVKVEDDKKRLESTELKCRETVIFWITEYVRLPKKGQMRTLRQTSSIEPRINEEIVKEETLKDENATLKSGFTSGAGESDTLTPFSTMPSDLQESQDLQMKESFEESSCGLLGDVFDFVQDVLFSTRENVNVLTELFRQAWKMPIPSAKDHLTLPTSHSAHRRVISVFRDWLQTEKPSFMSEPDADKVAKYLEEMESSLKEREKPIVDGKSNPENNLVKDSAGSESQSQQQQQQNVSSKMSKLDKEEASLAENLSVSDTASIANKGSSVATDPHDITEDDDSSEVSTSEFPLSKSDSVTTFCNSATSTLTIAEPSTLNQSHSVVEPNVESFDGDSGAYDSEGVSTLESLNPSTAGEGFLDGELPSAGQRAPLVGDEVFTRIRSWSYSIAVEQSRVLPSPLHAMSNVMHSVTWPPIPQPNCYVRAGLQKNLQLFIDYSATVFLRDLPGEFHPNHDHQVDLCKRVLNIYRYMVMRISMNLSTWETLLKALLKVTQILFQIPPSTSKETSLAGKLASPIFGTLIVTFIKANLNVVVSKALWDELLETTVKCTHWEELIIEWSKTMETLTRLMAREVYGLDLNNLPLDRLSEQKDKRLRGANRRSAEDFDIGPTVNRKVNRGLRHPKTNTFGPDWPVARPFNNAAVKTKEEIVSQLPNLDSPEVASNTSSMPASEKPHLGGNVEAGTGWADFSNFEAKAGLPTKFTTQLNTMEHSMSHPSGICSALFTNSPIKEAAEKNGSTSVVNDGSLHPPMSRYRSFSGDEQMKTEWNSESPAAHASVSAIRKDENPFSSDRDSWGSTASSSGHPQSTLGSTWSAHDESCRKGDNSRDSGVDGGNPDSAHSGHSPHSSLVRSSSDSNISDVSSGLTQRNSREIIPPGEFREGHHLSIFEPSSVVSESVSFHPNNSIVDGETVSIQSMNTEDSCCVDAQSNYSLESSGNPQGTVSGTEPTLTGSTDSQNNSALDNKSYMPAVSTADKQSLVSGHSGGSDPSHGSSLCPSPCMDREGHLDRESLHLDDDDVGRVDDVNVDDVIESSSKAKTGISKKGESETPWPDNKDVSVLAGGTLRGWTPEVSSILWKRMLCILGDINNIQDPDIHAQVLDCLNDFCDTLRKIKDNLGISLDNQSTPEIPAFAPPINIMTPWLFKAAFGMSERYKKGKVLAYRLLCNMTVQRDTLHLLPVSHMAEFYRALHYGFWDENPFSVKLNGGEGDGKSQQQASSHYTEIDLEIVSTVFKACGSKIFGYSLPGVSLLVADFVQAAICLLVPVEKVDKRNRISASIELGGAPRSEAATILGCLLCHCSHLSRGGNAKLRVLNPGPTAGFLGSLKDPAFVQPSVIQETIFNQLLKTAMTEPLESPAKAVAVCALVTHIYEDLSHQKRRVSVGSEANARKSSLQPPTESNTVVMKLEQVVKVLCLSLQQGPHQKGLREIACDSLLLLCDQKDFIIKNSPKLVDIVVITLLWILYGLAPECDLIDTEEDGKVGGLDKNLVISLLFCLYNWCMATPLDILLNSSTRYDSSQSLIAKVFKVVHTFESKCAVSRPFHKELKEQFSLLVEDGSIAVAGSSTTTTTTTAHAPSSNSTSRVPRQRYSSATSSSQGEYGPKLGTSSIPCTPLDSSLPQSSVNICAKFILNSLLNHVAHWPFQAGASCLSSLIHECHDLPNFEPDDLSAAIFESPNAQFFILNSSCLISLVEIAAPNEAHAPGGPGGAGLTSGQTVIRVIIRDFLGKTSWDSAILYGPSQKELVTGTLATPSEPPPTDKEGERRLSNASMLQQLLRSTDLQHQLYTEQTDFLDPLLRHIGATSPECLVKLGIALNQPADPPVAFNAFLEEAVVDMVKRESGTEAKRKGESADVDNSFNSKPTTPKGNGRNDFQLGRLFLNDLNWLAWEKRPRVDLLRKSERLLRELKNLDAQRCRETHKLAVIYIGKGQEDKVSILTNQKGSPEYEQFMASLGWEIDLASHPGFMAGLQRNQSNGATTVYWATPTTEVTFHVSTRMPGATEEERHRKLRHLGNDEIQIIWSEHDRDYRRGVIPTEFGDVIICIYPLPSKLFRIKFLKKSDIPAFGPLYDGAIVDRNGLAGLVRATAINASRAKRSTIPYYVEFFEERSRNLKKIVEQHRHPTTFEEFSSKVVDPVTSKLKKANPPPVVAAAAAAATSSSASKFAVSAANAVLNNVAPAVKNPEAKDALASRGSTASSSSTTTTTATNRTLEASGLNNDTLLQLSKVKLDTYTTI